VSGEEVRVMSDVLMEIFIFGMVIGTAIGLLIGAIVTMLFYRRDAYPEEPTR